MVGEFELDLSWLPTTGWAAKGRRPKPTLRQRSLGLGISSSPVKETVYENPAAKVAEVATGEGWEFRWGFDDPEALKRAGTILAVGGGVMSAIGAYSAASSARYQSDSAALAFEFESKLSGTSAQRAEHDAQAALAAGKMEIGRMSLAFGQLKSERRAVTAGRGVRLDRGSTARVAASEEIRERIDEATIRENAVREAGAARLEKARYVGQSLVNRASATNARRMAKLYDPFLAAATSILTSLGDFGSQVASDRNRTTRR